MTRLFNFRTRRVGGIRFVRLGRWQLTFCVCRRPFRTYSQEQLAAFWREAEERREPVTVIIREFEGGKA